MIENSLCYPQCIITRYWNKYTIEDAEVAIKFAQSHTTRGGISKQVADHFEFLKRSTPHQILVAIKQLRLAEIDMEIQAANERIKSLKTEYSAIKETLLESKQNEKPNTD